VLFPRSCHNTFVCLLGLALVLVGGCRSSWRAPDGSKLPPLETHNHLSKEDKVILLNGAMAAAVLAYGFEFWDYGGTSFSFKDEGWFGQHTDYGGADKLGHAYAAYLTAIGLGKLYEHWGYDRETADRMGFWSSFGAFTLIEVGDAMSKYGFSLQDLVFDAAGAGLGYLRRRHPKLGTILDFRIEYIPSKSFTSGGHTDIWTDYSGYKYLLALKLEGIGNLGRTPLGWVELQAGYYTRGYVTSDAAYFSDKTRTFYVAIGLNVSRLFKKIKLKPIGTFFEYYQAPYTYVPFDIDLE